jgi:hypothetical protein
MLHRYKRLLAKVEAYSIKKGLGSGVVVASFFSLLYLMVGVGLWFGVYLVADFRRTCLHEHPMEPWQCVEPQLMLGECLMTAGG